MHFGGSIKLIGFRVTDLDSVPGYSVRWNVTGHLISETVSTSVKWIIVRIQWDYRRGERASYKWQGWLSGSCMAPGRRVLEVEEQGLTPVSALSAVMPLAAAAYIEVFLYGRRYSGHCILLVMSQLHEVRTVIAPFFQLR